MFIGNVFKVRIFQESQGCLKVMSTRSGLFRHQVYKVRFAYRSGIQVQDCFEVIPTRSGLSGCHASRPGLFRGHVFKVIVLDLISSKSGFTQV